MSAADWDAGPQDGKEKDDDLAVTKKLDLGTASGSGNRDFSRVKSRNGRPGERKATV
jgi:hypothetical protein